MAERQANVVAHLVRRQGYQPADFQTALSPLLGQDIADVVVIERSHAFALAIGDVREIFRFFVYRDPGEPSASWSTIQIWQSARISGVMSRVST